MLRFVLKKMRYNKWLFLCLIFAAIMVNALICSITVYSRATAAMILNKKFETLIKDENKCPGQVSMNCSIGLHLENKDPRKEFKDFEDQIVSPFIKETGMTQLCERVEVNTKDAYVLKKEMDIDGNRQNMGDSIWAVKDIESHIKLIGGKGYSDSPEIINTGLKNAPRVQVVELLIEKEAYSWANIAIGEKVILLDHFGNDLWNVDDLIKEKDMYIGEIVGVYEKVDDGSGFWQVGNEACNCSLLMNYDVAMNRVFKEHPSWFNEAYWHLNYDYTTMDMNRAQTSLKAYTDTKEKFKTSFVNKAGIETGYGEVVEACNKEVKKLTMDILLFMLPVLFMLGLFIFMITQFIVSGDRNEIATLRSRGATKWHIFSIYLGESMFISCIAILIGPFIAVGICKVLGSASGFLAFVGRKALPARVEMKTYFYALLAQMLFTINMFLPVMIYANVNVVEHSKRNIVQKRSLWKLLGVDFICLAISIYFLMKYYKKVKRLLAAEIVITDTGIDPILYLISTLLILGLALFFLRIYPLFIRFVGFVGKKYWSATFYASFKNIGRVRGNELFIMLFMIMAIGIGVLNANEARSYNGHNEESIRYAIGSDVVITPEWIDFNRVRDNYSSGPNKVEAEKRPDYWLEPDIEPYKHMEGVADLCKVAYKTPFSSYINEKMVHSDTMMMAIEPYEFGKVTWYKNGLLPTHINDYLNIMTQSKQAIFVTSNAKKEQDLKIGDNVELVINDSKGFEAGRVTGTICGFVDYWPGIQTKTSEGKELVSFIVNYRYIENVIGVIPYDLWIDLDQTTSESKFLDELTQSEAAYDDAIFEESEVIKMRNEPYNMGINGTLTLGFIVIMLITMIGFIIYWILAIKERSLQFGIMRAMGVSKGGIYSMLLVEQILLFGSAIIVGVIIGSFTSEIVVPLLQLLGRKVTDTYPAVVAFKRSDYLKVYAMTFIMLGSSMAVIIKMMRKIKVADILKLGEER